MDSKEENMKQVWFDEKLLVLSYLCGDGLMSMVIGNARADTKEIYEETKYQRKRQNCTQTKSKTSLDHAGGRKSKAIKHHHHQTT